MKTSVVIPTYNRWNSLKKCLDSLINQSSSPDQVLVIDGGSNDYTPKGIKSYPVEFKIQDKKGLVYAYNYGAKKANGDIIAFIDDDAIAKSDWIEQLENKYASSKTVGAVGGQIVEMGKRPKFSIENTSGNGIKIPNFLFSVYSIIFLENRIHDIGVITENGGTIGNFSKKLIQDVTVDHIRGVNMSFRKDVIKKIGFFDSRFDLYHATLFETDACFRVSVAGYDIWYTPKAVVWHCIRSGGSDIRSLAHNDLLFYIKNIRKNRNYIDIAFLLRYLSQLTFNIFANINQEDQILSYIKKLADIPPIIARSFVASNT